MQSSTEQLGANGFSGILNSSVNTVASSSDNFQWTTALAMEAAIGNANIADEPTANWIVSPTTMQSLENKPRVGTCNTIGFVMSPEDK